MKQRVLVLDGHNATLQMAIAASLMGRVRDAVSRADFILVHDEIVPIPKEEKMAPVAVGKFSDLSGQTKAYRQGKKDAEIYGMIPTAKMVTDLTGITDDEAIVCYMNGVGDALAGL